jgi:uncharacterized protein
VEGLDISYIIIDGYNVTGILHKNMEKAREELLSQLAEYRKIREHDITVVFDGYKFGMSTQQMSYHGGVRVIFTRLGERADDVIKKTVSQERRGWIVVTADRDIIDHAWAAGAVPVPPDRFMDIISRRCRPGEDEGNADVGKDECEENMERGRKGNPRQLSKKEKLLRQALSKL